MASVAFGTTMDYAKGQINKQVFGGHKTQTNMGWAPLFKKVGPPRARDGMRSHKDRIPLRDVNRL